MRYALITLLLVGTAHAQIADNGINRSAIDSSKTDQAMAKMFTMPICGPNMVAMYMVAGDKVACRPLPACTAKQYLTSVNGAFACRDF